MVLDGFDLGIGLILPFAPWHKQKAMIDSTGPYWDANETWIVLSLGILLIAFPKAQGIVLGKLYEPIFIMLFGIILRGIAYEFRTKCIPKHVRHWHTCFAVGSLMMSASQGFILAIFCCGLVYSSFSVFMASLAMLVLGAVYVVLGAGWLLMKSTNEIQGLAKTAARYAIRIATLGLTAMAIVVYWHFAEALILVGFSCIILCWLCLEVALAYSQRLWICFLMGVLLLLVLFVGMAYITFPYIVPFSMTLWEGAASLASLNIIFITVVVLLPIILAYTVLLHLVFWGKVTKLDYD